MTSKLINMDIQIIAAIIGVVGMIAAACITGIFTLIKNEHTDNDKYTSDTNDNNEKLNKSSENRMNNNANLKTVDIPKSVSTVEKNNDEEYLHNSFIPNLDELEKEDSDDAFAEGLAIFLRVNRKDEDISITRRGE